MSENPTDILRQLERELGVQGHVNVLRAALKLAKDTVAQLKEAEPPAPPAWMVEVAWEATARKNEADGLIGFAQSVRAGDQDRCDEVTTVIAALRLALERGHVVEPREWTEEELLKAAMEDAVQALEAGGWTASAREIRLGMHTSGHAVIAALQARRNMLREGAVAVQTKAPEVDLEALATVAWSDGWTAAAGALHELHHGQGNATTLCVRQRSRNVSELLSTLPTREA